MTAPRISGCMAACNILQWSHPVHSHDCPATQAGRSGCSCLRVPLHLTEPISRQAVQIFLQNVVLPTPNRGSISKGHFATLPALVDESPATDALPAALEAIALASCSTRFAMHELRFKALQRYTFSARHLVALDLASTSRPLNIIACMLLLGLFEVVYLLFSTFSHNV